MNPKQNQTPYNSSPANQKLASEQPPTVRKHKSPILIIVICIVGFAFSAVIVAGILIIVGFSGGVKGLYDEIKPVANPTSNKVMTKRKAAKNELITLQNRVQNQVGLSSPLAVSTSDVCYKGQHNYVVNDAYAQQCKMGIAYYYAFSTDFITAMLATEKALNTVLTQQSSEITNAVQDYRKNYGVEFPYLHPGPFLVSDLAIMHNEQNGVSWEIAAVEKASYRSSPLFGIDSYPNVWGTVDITYQKHTEVAVKQLVDNALESNAYVIQLTMVKTYHTE